MKALIEQVVWVRQQERLTFTEPRVYFGLGIRGSGKSSVLETIGEYHLDAGHAIMDLFSSRDGENLAWCRSEWAEDKKVLLLHGENVDIKAPFKTKKAEDLYLHDFNTYDLVISCPIMYLRPEDEFEAVNKIIDRLYRRPPSWSKLIYVIAREAANLFYSRLRISKSQLAAKSEVAYLTREMRHQGISLGIDSIITTAVDYQVRVQSDWTFIKSMGITGIRDDDPLFFLYSFFNPAYIRRMPKREFLIATKQGALGAGSFEELPWHKKPKENILAQTDISVEYGEPKEPLRLSSAYAVGDKEHSQIVTLYIKEGLAMNKIADKTSRSSKTVHKHITEHNQAIERSGFCPTCSRAKSIHHIVRAERGST